MQAVIQASQGAIAACFGKAAASYQHAARLQRQVAYQALAGLTAAAATSGTTLGKTLDVGCGPGWLHPELAPHTETLTALDFSAGMLAAAKAQGQAAHYLLADAAAIPLADASINTVFSSLMLQWCPEPAEVLREINRVLMPGGRAVVTTLVAGTLSELQTAFAAVDQHQHVQHFLPLNALSAAAEASGASWQLVSYQLDLHYPDIFALAKELKQLGASYIANRGRQGLTGKGYWQQVAAAYPNASAVGLTASYQVAVLQLNKPCRD